MPGTVVDMLLNAELDPLSGEHVVGRTAGGKILVETRHHRYAPPVGALGLGAFFEPVDVLRQGEKFAKTDLELYEDVLRGAPTFRNGRKLTARKGDIFQFFFYEDDGSIAVL